MTVAGQITDERLSEVKAWAASEITACAKADLRVSAQYFAAVQTLLTELQYRRAAPVVKALEWNEFERSGGTVYADTLFGRYSAWDFDGQDGHWKSPSGYAGVRVDGGIEVAKAAAQSHHDALILSALGEHP